MFFRSNISRFCSFFLIHVILDLRNLCLQFFHPITFCSILSLVGLNPPDFRSVQRVMMISWYIMGTILEHGWFSVR